MREIVANAVDGMRLTEDAWGPASRWEQGRNWFVLSDYAFHDDKSLPRMKNHVAGFTAYRTHAGYDETLEFLKKRSPRDLKKTKNPDDVFLTYLASREMFHYTFVLDRSTKLLRQVLTIDRMEILFHQLASYAANYPVDEASIRSHLEKTTKKLLGLSHYVKQRNANLSHLRQMVLVASYAAACSAHLADIAAPSRTLWVSDRDAIADIQKGLIFDMAQLLYLNQLSSDKRTMGRTYRTTFHGVVHDSQLDPLLRIPDFITGTAADYDFDARAFSHNKFSPVAERLFMKTSNHAMFYVSTDGEQIKTERRTLTPSR